MSQLKLVTGVEPTKDYTPYIKNEDEGPVLAYKVGGETITLKSGSLELIKCSDLEEILGKYFISGTKFIVSAYNPVLYYLFPGYFPDQFKPSTDFIPQLPISTLVRGEVDGFNVETVITQDSIKSIKACDSWYDNPTISEEAEIEIDNRINQIFGFYNSIDIIQRETGDYAVDLSRESLVVSLISGTTYTDTVSLKDWAYSSGKDGDDVTGKLDISFMYSVRGVLKGGMQTIKAFRHSGDNVISEDTIIDLGDIQLEYFSFILKIYPVSEEIDEIAINDCTLTIGVL